MEKKMTEKLLITAIVILLFGLFVFMYINNPASLFNRNKGYWENSNNNFERTNSLIIDTMVSQEIKYIKYKNYITNKGVQDD